MNHIYFEAATFGVICFGCGIFLGSAITALSIKKTSGESSEKRPIDPDLYKDVDAQVLRIVSQVFGTWRERLARNGIEKDDLAVRLEEDLGADSLDMVELVGEAEDVFEIEILEEEVKKLKTLKDFANLIKSRVEVTKFIKTIKKGGL